MDWEAFLEVWEGLGGPFRRSRRPTRRSVRDRESHPKVQEESGDRLGGLEGLEWPT